MAALPFDILYLVLCVLDSDDLRDRFAVAGVSQRWRDAALSCPSFWSTFVIASRSDANLLPLLLARSAGVQLQVTVDFADQTTRVRATERKWQHSVARSLVKQAHRLHELVVYINHDSVPEAVCYLMDKKHTMPELYSLKVLGATFLLATPKLRRLELQRAWPWDYKFTLVPSIEVLHLRDAADATVISDVLRLCTNLRELEMHSVSGSTMSSILYGNSHSSAKSLDLRHIPSSLRSLSLGLPDNDTAPILAALVSAKIVLDNLSVSLSGGQGSSTLLQTVLEVLCSDLVAPILLEVRADKSLILRDAHGRSRTVRIREPWNDSTMWNWDLVSAHVPLERVRNVTFDIEMWSEILPWALHWHELDELCIRVSTKTFQHAGFPRKPEASRNDLSPLDHLPRLVCARYVHKVRFEMTKDARLSSDDFRRVVKRLTIPWMGQDAQSSVQVCVGARAMDAKFVAELERTSQGTYST